MHITLVTIQALDGLTDRWFHQPPRYVFNLALEYGVEPYSEA
jgi:hypothetical protein